MDAALEQIEGLIASDNSDRPTSVDESIHRHLHASFGSAFWALAFALALPAIVFVFGAIRAREFQLSPDPRWAQFVPFTKSKSPTVAKSVKSRGPSESSRLPVQTASIRTELFRPAPRACHPELKSETTETPAIEESVGQVERTESLEEKLEKVRVEPAVEVELDDSPEPDRQQAAPQPMTIVEFEPPHDSARMNPNHRIETQMQEIHERLDQLVDRWALQHAENREQAKPDSSSIDGPKEVSNNDDSIRIRREAGPDFVPVFTIDAQDADIRQLFLKLSEAADVGILASPTVQGRITFHLPPVRLESAVRAIALSRNLDFRREHGIIVIRTIDEAAKLPTSHTRTATKVEVAR